MDFAKSTKVAREWLIASCLPFLQPNQDLWEAIFTQDLKVQIIMTRARLMQLLSSASQDSETSRITTPPSQYLHYTAKATLTEAYVEGTAVRAVCGTWWVPSGDEFTHQELPICPDCNAEEPFAQRAVDLLREFRNRQ